MTGKRRFNFIISEPESIMTAIDLMTRKHAFVWLECGADYAAKVDKSKLNAALKEKEGKVRFLHIGKKILSRDLTDPNDFADDITVRDIMQESGTAAVYEPFKYLRITENAELSVSIYAPSEFCANAMFIGNMLQFYNPLMKWYMDSMFADISVYLKNTENCANGEDSIEFIDLKKLDLYGELKEILFSSTGYDDNYYLEYFTYNGEEKVRYFFNEWYSNHLWSADPAVLSSYRVSACVSGCAEKDEVQSVHSHKCTEDIMNNKYYYIDEIQSVSKQYMGRSVHNERARFDSLKEFKDWIEDRDYEIARA